MTSSILNFDYFANVESVTNESFVNSHNKNSSHILGKKAKIKYEEAYDMLHDLFPMYDNIEFISGGGTQANKRAILGSINLKPKFISQGKRRNTIIVSSIEHTSIMSYIVPYLREHEYIIYTIPCDDNGVISAAKLSQFLESHADSVALISIMNVNNETGIIQDIESYLEIVSRYPHIIFHSDMAQGIQFFHHNMNKYNVLPDVISFSGYKLGVPNFGVVLSSRKLNADYFGTSDVSGIYHLVNVVHDKLLSYEANDAKNKVIKNHLVTKLVEKLVELNIDHKMFTESLSNIVSLLLFGYQSSMIQMLLSSENICIGTGSACTAVTKSNIGSYTIKEMGYVDSVTFNLIRLSWNNITIADADLLIDKLIMILHKLKPLVEVPEVIKNNSEQNIVINGTNAVMTRNKSQEFKHEKISIEEPVDILKYKFRISIGESYLKGGNKGKFITLLMDDIMLRFKDVIDVTHKMLHNDKNYITLHVANHNDVLKYVNILKLIPGISVIVPIKYFKNNYKLSIDNLFDKIYNLMVVDYKPNQKICIRSKIYNKEMIKYTTTDINTILGKMMVDKLGASVDLTNPDIKYDILFGYNHIEISTEKYSGLAGLPLKSEGHVDIFVDKNNLVRSICACIKLSIRGIIINVVPISDSISDPINDCNFNLLIDPISKINPYITVGDALNTDIIICETDDFNILINKNTKSKYYTSLTTHMTYQQVLDYLVKYNVHIKLDDEQRNIDNKNIGFLSMISGGIDSPVSSYLMSKCSNNIKLIHFATTIDKIDVVKNIQKKLDIKELFVVEFDKLQFQIVDMCPENYRTLLFKLFMVKIANEIAKQEKLDIIIMGNSLGQVSSQTYENIVMTNRISELPIYNPLLGTSKDDIIDEARIIETFNDSICTGTNDCCTLFLPKHPIIKSNPDVVDKYIANFSNFMNLVTVHKIY